MEPWAFAPPAPGQIRYGPNSSLSREEFWRFWSLIEICLKSPHFKGYNSHLQKFSREWNDDRTTNITINGLKKATKCPWKACRCKCIMTEPLIKAIWPNLLLQKGYIHPWLHPWLIGSVKLFEDFKIRLGRFQEALFRPII